MFYRAITTSVAVLVAASPAIAQERGTIEVGAFGNRSFYDSSININDGWGGGARFGAFIIPRLSVEFDIGRRDGSRPLGLQTVEVEAFAARLLAVPVKHGSFSLLAGAGLIHTDYDADVSDGLQALLGAKLDLRRNLALRVEGLMDFNENDTRNQAVQAGLSYYRHPAPRTLTVDAVAPRPDAPPQRPDPVSAAETRRLRVIEAEYQALRASIPQPVSRAPSSVAALATMNEVIHFAHDESVLDSEARSILDAKLPVFRANPAMRIVITGHTSAPGTATYNWALGFRRAQATRAYLVSRGVDPIRIEITTGGEGHLAMDGSSERAAAANRRAEFRILAADPHLTAGR